MATNQSTASGEMVALQSDLVLSISNPQFATYLIVTSLLILKISALILLTAFHRQKNKIFSNEEDIKMNGGSVESHPDIERVRRAVLNDLENIPAFLFISLAYLFVGVPNWVVHFLFYLFLIARIMHSIVYAVYVIPQPARGLSFMTGFAIINYMSIHVLIHGICVGYLGK